MIELFTHILVDLIVFVASFLHSSYIDPSIDYCARGMKAREELKDDAGERAGEDDLRRGLIQNPKNHACRFAYGRALTSAGLVTDARRELKRVIAETDSDSLKAEARRFLEIRLPPLDIPFNAQRLNNDGWQTLFCQNDPDAAIPLFKLAISIEPRFTWAWSNLAQAYQQKKDYKKAIDAAKRAVKIAPFYRNGYRTLAKTLSDAGRYSEAIGSWEKVIEIEPNNAYAERELGYAHVSQVSDNIIDRDEHLRNALLHFKRALFLEPNDQWTRSIFAWTETELLDRKSGGSGKHSEAGT